MNYYDDIINLNRPLSSHKKMTINSRAGQFAPFSALNGYDDEIKAAGKITNQKKEIDEETTTILNNKLQLILKNIKGKPRVTITYFVKDNLKNEGTYKEITDNIKRFDEAYKIIYLNNIKIKLIDIIDIIILSE